MPKEKGAEWQHVIIIEESQNLTGSKLRCIYCDKEFKGGVTRIRGHILGDTKLGIAKCAKVPEVVTALFKDEENKRDEAEAKKRKFAALSKLSSDSTQSTNKQLKLTSMIASTEKVDADRALARMFYANGLPFALAESKYFKEAIAAVARSGASYKPPGRAAISTTLLQAEVADIDQKLAVYTREAAITGITLVSDGWSNVQNRPIINFLAVGPDGAIFLDAVDTSGETKDGKFIANALAKVIDAQGKDNVVQVVTDSAANCVSARKQLAELYPGIVFSPCAAHCLDLLLEDIGKMAWLKVIIDQGHDVVKFITNHQTGQAIFRSHSKLELLKPVATRFASFFIMLQRVLECKDALQETVVNRDYKAWMKNSTYKETGQRITDTVLNNDFWQSVSQAVALCEPIVALLRLVDGNASCTGKIYWRMFKLCQTIEQSDLPTARRKQIHQLAMDRWKMLHTELHAAGFVLDPEYREFLQHENEEVITGFHSVIEKVYQGDVAAQVKAIQQHTTYRAGLGLFARPMAAAAAKEMPAHTWWLSFGSHVPELQKVAVRVLAQVSSASACERNWSTFDFIHTKKRNRLECKKVRDVVFVHSNLRLKEKLANVIYETESIEWEWGSEAENSDNDN